MPLNNAFGIQSAMQDGNEGCGAVPAQKIRYICPFPGCNRSFRDFWRLKVHYRAQPGARGSGVERGHGMELPFCPLCNLDLRDVKYHKCTAGPAACAPARARNNQAMAPSSMNNMGHHMQLPGPCAAPGHLMMPSHGPFNFSAGQPHSMHPMQQQYQQQQFPQQQYPLQQQQYQQQHSGLPMSMNPGHMQQQQQQLMPRSGSDSMQSNGQPDIPGMPMMQTSGGLASAAPQHGNSWWANPTASSTQQQQQQALPQLQLQQQQQQQPQMQLQQQFQPHWQPQRPMQAVGGIAHGSNSSGSSGSNAGPVGMHPLPALQQQQQQLNSFPQQQQMLQHGGLQRMSSGAGAGTHLQAGMQSSYPLSGLHRPTPLPAMPAADGGIGGSSSGSMGQLPMSQVGWNTGLQQGHAAAAANSQGMSTGTGTATRMPSYHSNFSQPQQQQRGLPMPQMQQHMSSSYSGGSVPAVAAANVPCGAAACPAPASMGQLPHNSYSGATAGSSFTNGWLPGDSAAAAAAAAKPSNGFMPSGPQSMQAAAGLQQQVGAFGGNGSLQQQHYDSRNDCLPVDNSTDTTPEATLQVYTASAPDSTATEVPAAAAAAEPTAAAAMPQLQISAARIVDDFKAALDGLRMSISGSSGGINIGLDVSGASMQQQEGLPRGNSGSSCCSSPVSSSVHCHAGNGMGAAAAAGATAAEDVSVQVPVVGSKRSALDQQDQSPEGSAANPKRSRLLPLPPSAPVATSSGSCGALGAAGVERQGSVRPVSGLGVGVGGGLGRTNSWADTPPPTEAQEALLQLAAHVESEVATVTGATGIWSGSSNMAAAAAPQAQQLDGSNRPGVVHDVAQAQDCDNPHAAQVSQLLAAALEAANKCFQDPAPVVQKLLSVLDEHITMLSHRMDTSEGPAAAAAVPDAAVADAPAAANNAAALAEEEGAAPAADQVQQQQQQQLWQLPMEETLQQQQQAVLLPGVAGPVLLQQNMPTAEPAAQQMAHGSRIACCNPMTAAAAAAAFGAQGDAAGQPGQLCVEKVQGTASSPAVTATEQVQA